MTSATSTPLADLNKEKTIMFSTTSEGSKIVCGSHYQEQRVKFDVLPTNDKKERKPPQRRRTPYAWDDQLRPIFDDKKNEKKEK
jgi:hypothetical protein